VIRDRMFGYVGDFGKDCDVFGKGVFAFGQAFGDVGGCGLDFL